MKTLDLLEILKCCYSFPNKHDTRQSSLKQHLTKRKAENLPYFLSSKSSCTTWVTVRFFLFPLFFSESQSLFKVPLLWCSVVGWERMQTVIHHVWHKWAKKPDCGKRASTLKPWKIQIFEASKHLLYKYLVNLKHLEWNGSLSVPGERKF